MNQYNGLKKYISSIRQGLILAIPFLMVGSFSLVLNTFPWPLYQSWLANFAGGALSELFSSVYQVTLGALAFVLAVTISYAYGQIIEKELTVFFVLSACCSYLAFTGFPFEISGMSDNIFAAEWVFTSMCITLLSCRMFQLLYCHSSSWKFLHTVGGEYYFNLTIRTVVSSSVTIICFALLGELLVLLLGDRNILNFGSYFFLLLFQNVGDNIFSVLLYIFFSHLLWFFGVHGTNTLEAVSTSLFEQNIALNQSLIASGEPAVHVYSKTFLDVFVFPGGCGSAICMILALLLVSRNFPNKKLAKLSAIPVWFNINEPILYGFPVIFNVNMLIPFIGTPILMAITSTAAMKLGLVPLAVVSVGWTVPVPFSGMMATNSIAGSILQIFNIVLGTCFYIPFVRKNEQKQIEKSTDDIRRLEQAAKEAELQGQLSHFLDNGYELNHVVKTLMMDIHHTLEKGGIQIYYQPQSYADGSVHGGEALLRWHHPLAGHIYPPLIVMLARQGGFLDQLGFSIIHQVCQDMERMWQEFHKPFHISLNVSPDQLDNPDFVSQVSEIVSGYSFGDMELIFEFTEQIALMTTAATTDQLKQLQSIGIGISMDDFGMGHGSVMYLNNSLFDEVKLDGSLIEQLTENDRSKEIVQSITKLSHVLHFDVVAEYVETQKQIELLQELGCTIYQGYYFSQAVSIDGFLEYVADKL